MTIMREAGIACGLEVQMSTQGTSQPYPDHHPGSFGTDARVPYSTRKKWFHFFPIDGDGLPTSDAAHQLIRYLFINSRQSHRPETLARKLMLHPELVRCMCRQLETVDVVVQEPAGSGLYRYALHSPNVEVQRKLEVALLDYASCPRGLKRPPLPPL
jgi:hypothetical protein